MFDVIFVGVASAITLLITASLSLGGGVTLLAMLGQILPLKCSQAWIYGGLKTSNYDL